MGIVEVILLDTHVWIWWVHGDAALPSGTLAAVHRAADRGLGVSAISCWEVAKLVEKGRLELPMQMDRWMDMALDGSGIQLIPLSPEVAVASTTLPGEFHRDSADQIIVATSRVHDFPLATCDQRIRRYAHVRLLDDERIHDR